MAICRLLNATFPSHNILYLGKWHIYGIVHLAWENKARKTMATYTFFFFWVPFFAHALHTCTECQEKSTSVLSFFKMHFGGNSEWNINILLLLIFKRLH